MVVPSFSALLSYATGQVFRYSCPVSRAEFLDIFCKDLVFFLGPIAHDKVRAVVQCKPSGVALNLGLSGQEFADS